MIRTINIFSARAFTLVELLVTVSVIGVLTSLVAPALSRAKGYARKATCASNFKQFAIAQELYAGDHGDSLLPNADGRGVKLGETWVEGWLGTPGPDTTNTSYLKRSLLGAYIPEPGIWRCPSSMVNPAATRVRTLSLNAFIGSSTNREGAQTYRKTSDLTRPCPSELITFLDERMETINDASFALQVNFQIHYPGSWVLRDKPSTEHRGGGTLAWGDGHVEGRFWKDQRTGTAPRDDASQPGNPDILWLQQHCTWRED